MLYFCFPITELNRPKNLIGRTAETKERGEFIFNAKNYKIILDITKIFGILSPAHNKDIIEIIKTIIE